MKRDGREILRPETHLVSRERALRAIASKKDIRLLSKFEYILWNGDAADLLAELERAEKVDLVVTSPPYNLGKEYESRTSFAKYLLWQEKLIERVCKVVKPTGSICWQVGNYVDNGEIIPLDIALHPIFAKFGMKLRNRIVWKFGHGFHSKRRFSGRYEVILWYTKSDSYRFNLDAVRIPSKYPGKRHYKGPNVGKFSSNPLGKNPEDIWEYPDEVWDIPNVKSNHIEKTNHPCQFPVGLVERLLLALSEPGALVLDPFTGVGSTGVACALHGRRFLGAEVDQRYIEIAEKRIEAALSGSIKYRPHFQPLYDHTASPLSVRDVDK